MIENYSVTKRYTAMTYRGLENILGVNQFVDGVLLKDGTLYYNSDHSAVCSGGDMALNNIYSGNLPTDGKIKTLGFDAESKLRLPTETTSTSNVYYVDSYGIDTNGNRRVFGLTKGLYTFVGTVSASSSVPNSYFRMIRTPK